MAMQLHAQGIINLLGITVVAGNQWLPQEVSDALKAVERMGLAGKTGVYAGARYPLVHDYKTMTYATQVVEMWVDVDTNWGPSYGHTLGYLDVQKPAANHLQKHKVVLRFNNDRFFKLYVDLLSRPVPYTPNN